MCDLIPRSDPDLGSDGILDPAKWLETAADLPEAALRPDPK